MGSEMTNRELTGTESGVNTAPASVMRRRDLLARAGGTAVALGAAVTAAGAAAQVAGAYHHEPAAFRTPAAVLREDEALFEWGQRFLILDYCSTGNPGDEVMCVPFGGTLCLGRRVADQSGGAADRFRKIANPRAGQVRSDGTLELPAEYAVVLGVVCGTYSERVAELQAQRIEVRL